MNHNFFSKFRINILIGCKQTAIIPTLTFLENPCLVNNFFRSTKNLKYAFYMANSENLIQPNDNVSTC